MTVLLAVAAVGGGLLLDRSRRSVVARTVAAGNGTSSTRRWSVPRWPVGGRSDRAADDAATIETIARSLRSGSSVHAALDEAAAREGALAEQLRRVVTSVSGGRLAADELSRAASVAPEVLRPALRLLAVAIHDGGSTADAVARTAAVVRDDQALRADARVQSTQARTSALAITALPLLFVALSMLTAPAVPGFLFGRQLGWLVLAVGLGLDALGWWWMRRLTHGALP